MKFSRIISLLLVFVMLLITLASCNLEALFGGNDTPEETTTTTESVVDPDPDPDPDPNPDPDPDPNPEPDSDRILTVAEAIEIAMAETSTNPTTRYLIRATIVKVSNPTYGEMTIADETGEIYVYGTYSADGALRYSEMEERPVKGDEVLLSCTQ